MYDGYKLSYTINCNCIFLQIVPPVAPRMVFTFFEVENYKELIDGTAVDGKPSLKEKGPYAFKEMREKKELNWTSNKEFLC